MLKNQTVNHVSEHLSAICPVYTVSAGDGCHGVLPLELTEYRETVVMMLGAERAVLVSPTKELLYTLTRS